MAFGNHPRRLSAEEWAVRRFADVIPIDGEPVEPENCPDAVTLSSYAIRSEKLVLDEATLHILDCPRCLHQAAVIRQKHKAVLLRSDKAHVRRFLTIVFLIILTAVLLAAYSLLARSGWFAPRTSAVPFGEARQQARAYVPADRVPFSAFTILQPGVGYFGSNLSQHL